MFVSCALLTWGGTCTSTRVAGYKLLPTAEDSDGNVSCMQIVKCIEEQDEEEK